MRHTRSNESCLFQIQHHVLLYIDVLWGAITSFHKKIADWVTNTNNGHNHAQTRTITFVFPLSFSLSYTHTYTHRPVVSSALIFDDAPGQNGTSATDATKKCYNVLACRGSRTASTHETPAIPPRTARTQQTSVEPDQQETQPHRREWKVEI